MKVKVCGIRRAEDAQLAVDLGADALGFILWPGSPRYIAAADAHAIVRSLPALVIAVGVFVDQDPVEIAEMARAIGLGAVQLHGAEPAAAYADSAVPVIKAVPVEAGVDTMRAVGAVPASATVLLDAHDPVRRGGTGRTIDWSVAARVARERRVILSGGLTAANVVEAVTAVGAYAVDVSSGVESAPGVKDSAKLRAFFEALGRHRSEILMSNQERP